VVAATAPLAYDGGTQTVSIQANGITNAQIANRTRSVVIPGGAFAAASGYGAVNFSGGRGRVIGARLDDGSNNVTSTMITVPRDFIAGSVPTLTVYWGTDEGVGGRVGSLDVRFDAFSGSPITSTTSSITQRATFSGSPTQGAIITSTVSTFTGSPTWNPGDVIVLTISRDTADSNQGNLYIVGVSFDYNADM
jgi:hypothetical protein